MIKTVQGDLIKMASKGDFDVIAHGCNCFNTMGAGIAKDIAKTFPGALEEDRKTLLGDPDKLGEISVVYLELSGNVWLTVVNAYTQYGYKRGQLNLSYKAIRACMREIKYATLPSDMVGLPMIGAGLGDGDWGRIKSIIEEELSGRDVTIVEYKQGN